MRTFVGAVPLSAAALAVSIVMALAFGRAVADRLGARTWVGVLLLFGIGLVLSATLVPTGSALAGAASSGTCDTSRIGLAPYAELTTVTFASLNVLLFVPLGLAVGLLPRRRASLGIVLLALALPFVVEAIQLLLPVLGRGCETADLFDNSLGLVIGMVLGSLGRAFLPVSASRPI